MRLIPSAASKLLKFALLINLSVLLLGCPSSDKDIDLEDLTNELIGSYHGEINHSTQPPYYSKKVYDVEITREKTNEINIKIQSQLQSRQNPSQPFANAGPKQERYFENGKVTETKRFIVSETRPTNWYEHYTAKTEIYIEGKLTGDVLAMVASYKFPDYKASENITINLKKK